MPHHPHRRWLRGHGYWKRLGPGIVTGKGLAASLRERFARPVLWGAVVLVAVANTFNIGADIGSMAAAAGLLVPVPYAVATIAFAMVMMVLEVAVPYHRYARVLRWLALWTATIWRRCGWTWRPGWAQGWA
jgi:Mn2+/Fe2+ NRAMP family transporter